MRGFARGTAAGRRAGDRVDFGALREVAEQQQAVSHDVLRALRHKDSTIEYLLVRMSVYRLLAVATSVGFVFLVFYMLTTAR